MQQYRHADQAVPPQLLVIEDEDNIALALEIVLESAGYRQERIAEGTGALERIRALRPDLVLLDVMLPGASGYDICQSARLDPDLASIPILMMTARGSAIERRKGLAMGANGFIAKPFDISELKAEISRLLSGPQTLGAGEPQG